MTDRNVSIVNRCDHTIYVGASPETGLPLQPGMTMSVSPFAGVPDTFEISAAPTTGRGVTFIHNVGKCPVKLSGPNVAWMGGMYLMAGDSTGVPSGELIGVEATPLPDKELVAAEDRIRALEDQLASETRRADRGLEMATKASRIQEEWHLRYTAAQDTYITENDKLRARIRDLETCVQLGQKLDELNQKKIADLEADRQAVDDCVEKVKQAITNDMLRANVRKGP